ncbi:mannose-1-phosphate guanylyltransferase [candidate division WOR-3 bacterium]|nr:mannose-1-phosphate guanylyltransferase [candidate division WOR-3 bacterium]
MTDCFTSIIIAGGKGERFWPLSTPERPKQFISIWNDRKESMLDFTYRRLEQFSPGNTWILTTRLLETTLDSAGYEKSKLMFEPFGRNTAMAVAYASVMFEDSILGVFPADHVIEGNDGFFRSLERAVDLAKNGEIVIFGMEPNRPDTGYGYIEIGEKTGIISHRVSSFKEKPDVKTAEQYLEKRGYLWNGGMFVFNSSVMLESFRKNAPQFEKSLSLLKEFKTAKDDCLLEEAYAEAPSLPIDIAIIEKAKNVQCVTCDFFWDDVGSWLALKRLKKSDSNGNVIIGKVSVRDVRNSILLAEDSLIAMGLANTVVIQGKSGTLVSSIENINDLKMSVGNLNEDTSGDK